MSQTSELGGQTQELGSNLPFLRRYARALTGTQDSGDRYAAATLEALLSDSSVIDEVGPRLALFQVFHKIWISSGAPTDNSAEGIEGRAQSYLSGLTPNSREALLLFSIEEMSAQEIATIMELTEDEVTALIETARQEMQVAVSGRVMIIEDEAIIAMDLENIVAEMGHRVTGVARTRAGAVELATQEKPDLILADIQLADNSSGIDAVNDILGHFGELPVIFITAFPERLLTGTRPEPAFLISKPYRDEQVVSAMSQAMFFASTEHVEG